MYCLFTKCTNLNVVRSNFSRNISFRSNPTCKKFTTMSKKVHKSNSYISINLENNTKPPSIRKQSISGSIKSGAPVSRKSEFLRLFSLAKPEKWKLTGAVCLLFISSAVSMSVPFALGKVLDIIYTNSENADMAREKLNQLCLVLIGVFVVGAFCNLGRVYIMSTAGYRMTQKLRMNVFSSILKQEQAFFDTRPTGELVNRISADTQIVGQALSSNISDGLRSTVMVLAGSGMMIYMSYELALVGLAIVPPVALLAVVYGRFTRKISRKVQDSLADATQIAEERISNIRTVRSFAQENKEVELYRTKVERILKMGYTESRARAIFFGMTGFSGNVIIISVLYYGGVMVSSHTITVGHLSSFLLYAAYIGVSVGGLSSFYTELNRSVGAARRLWEIIDKDSMIPNTGGLVPAVLPEGHIQFKNVSFSYPSRCDTAIFQNLNLEIAPGTTVAVVGPSGSGKSTLAALLLRLYDPNSGEVFLDGVDVKTLDACWLRKNIGTVSQEPILFSCSIKENILYGADNPEQITDEEFEKVVIEANVKEFAHKLPAGYETLVGERGVMLSGGQKQRVAIARALIKNPKILLLDEATSALDATSEHLVREALERIMKGRTVLTIAHRLSTIQNADIIAVLENGVIVEQGKYNDLINLPKGHFKELMKHQTFKEHSVPDELQSVGVL